MEGDDSMERKTRVALCQLKTGENKDENLEKAVTAVRSAADEGADIAVLPEMFICPYSADVFSDYAELADEGKTARIISAEAKSLGIYIHAGSIPETDKGGLYNTSLLFDKKGRIISKYRKIHLFDVDIKGGITFRESDTLDYGKVVKTACAGCWNIGLAICYDLRFPEMFRLMSRQGAQAFIVPATFNNITGPAHWELLVRSRAVDSQAYVIAVSAALNRDAEYKAYGHSMAADPWGGIICMANEEEQIIHADIDLSIVEKVRRQLPVLKHIRHDIY